MSDDRNDLQPLSHTVEAVDRLGLYSDVDLMTPLRHQARGVRDLVPDLVALSVTTTEPAITLTLTITDERLAALEIMRSERALENPQGSLVPPQDGWSGTALDEQRWQEQARSALDNGIRTSLTMPTIGTASPPAA